MLVLIAVVRVASTHRVFSEVLDEPAHVAAGYDWLSGVPYTIDPSHPPLERILSAIPLKLKGMIPSADPDFVLRGNHLLYYNDQYEKNLARARIGNLLLLILAIVSVACWTRRRCGTSASLVATALFTTIPAILGHAGVATTDLAVAATLALALLTVDRYLEQPTIRRALELGLAIGLGLLSKFSFLVFFPVSLVAILLARWPVRTRIKPLLATIGVALLVVWAAYRFDVSTLEAADRNGPTLAHLAVPHFANNAAIWFAKHIPVPAPLFTIGFLMVNAHNAQGHESYLLGRYSDYGWWYYFPVVWFYKTPLSYMFLLAWGIVLLLRLRSRSALEPLLIALAIMASVLGSSINIGIRHILPIYVPLALIAGYAVVEIWRGARDAFGRFALAAVLAWLFVGIAISHPDYLAWFNELAQPNPERIVVDSNLDWGQDVLRLARVVRKHKIENLHVLYAGNAWLFMHGVEAQPLAPYAPVKGWVAVSETALSFENKLGGFKWLEHYKPAARIGKSIRLYYIP